MHILLTNDDGIDAPGLAALAEAAAALGEVTVVAPAEPRSSCSHAVTADYPLQLISLGPRRYAVTGTPADCVRVALLHLALDVDLVLSGINAGGNLGFDILMSGTVAGAREAMLLGRKAIALSQYRQRASGYDWPRSAGLATAALEYVLRQEDEPLTYWNVNLPDIGANRMPPIVRCEPDPNTMPIYYDIVADGLQYRSDYHERPRLPSADVAHCFGGSITVSRLARRSEL
ncbi:MAG: 5'/3'-nucleotidase SurE [Pirellulaceae bacterium]